ncbi:hypothetical protein CBM2615_B60105 [Cupriavidus taiwanensis]|uniref:Uncharacterized protein n=1 Tax=Cupriavidus taiwanensis TaxID=164546 RepID=A0A375E9S9_9BURK|nr:hypothetical protein CBM2614_B50098 [Cupriavidus taiwanensis]SOZ69772.1 hypothetical protein CBM2615_B60105 [Cupriavidus taiwanensis]SOZ72954.1 hypothetical protein CBM2613_B50101 [Cupriavidus taiwanensis]SPA09861.1 hypothetical protein CBM2625_B60017 [Cupriavidus taiwanensis]
MPSNYSAVFKKPLRLDANCMEMQLVIVFSL